MLNSAPNAPHYSHTKTLSLALSLSPSTRYCSKSQSQFAKHKNVLSAYMSQTTIVAFVRNGFFLHIYVIYGDV